ncbi:MAG: ComEA family DNA-binding protein, partial [Candidatus Aminicenantales bacterium]
ELESLPRIGPKVAQRIVDFRTKNGNFKRIEEIMKIQGIGEKVFDQIKDLITVGAETAPK